MPIENKSYTLRLASVLPRLLIAAISLFAVFAGLVIGFGALGAIIALLTGVLLLGLLFKPLWLMHLILVFGLLVVGVVPLWADGLAGKSVWGVSLLGFALMIASLVRLTTNREVARGTPTFVWLVLVFVAYVVLHSLFQWSSASEFFSGFKRYFQVTGLVFAMVWFAIDAKTISRWRLLIVIVASFQLPWTIYQLVVLVPLRESLRFAYPGMIPIDVVAGTFGSSMYSGGANAEMATFLVIFLAFLLARHREKLISIGRLACFILFIVPLFLGETKVVVVLLPLMFFTLYRREFFRRPAFALGAVVIGAGLTISAAYVYLNLLGKTFDQQLHDTVEYNLNDRGYGTNVLNRTTTLTFWVKQQGIENPAGAVLGYGLGTAHTATGGHLTLPLAGYGIDLTAASTLLWEQGPAGLVLFILILISAWYAAGKLVGNAVSAEIRADASAIQATIPIFAFYLIYRVAYLESMPFQIVFYGLMGYLAWLARIANGAVRVNK